MPDADQPDASTVTVEGVHIEKRLERDRFPIPTVEFTIRSDRDDQTEFHLIDEIPDSIPMENVGFHPEYGSEHWTAYENHHVRFDSVIEPGEEITTVYGIRTDGDLDETALLADPVVKIPGADTVGALDRLDDGDIDELLNDVLEDDEPLSDLLDEGSPMAPGLGDDPTASDELTEAESEMDAETETTEATAAVDDDPLDTGEGTPIDLDEEPPAEVTDEPADIADAEIGDSIDPDIDEAADGEIESEGTDAESPVDLGEDDTDAIFEGSESTDTTANNGDADPFGNDLESEESPEPEPEGASESGATSPLSADESEAGGEAIVDDDGGVEIGVDERSPGETEPAEETEGTDDPDPTTDATMDAAESPIGEDSTTQLDSDDDSDEAAGGEPPAVGERDLVATLAEEIRSGSADQADIETLADQLDAEIARSRDVRLHHVQSRVDDLAAYTDALKEFIDDNGTAAELIEDFETEVDDLRDDLGDLEGTVDTVAETQSDLTEQLDGIEAQLDAVESELESAATATEKLDALESEVASTTENVDGMTDDIESMKSELSALSEDVGSVANEMEDLQADLTERVEGVESDLETITDRLDELESWREQLKSALGPD